MSIRTNPMKAVPTVQRRLTKVKSREVPRIAEKLDELMLELENIKDLFSKVKANENEFLDTLKILDDLLRSFNKEKNFLEIYNRILQPHNATTANQEKGESSSSKEAEEKKNVEKDVTIDEKLESLKYELDNMKAKFSAEKKKEELLEKFRAVEDLLQNFNAKSLAENEIKPTEDDANQSERKGLDLSRQTSSKQLVDQAIGNDKSSSSQEAQDKKSVEKDMPIDEKLESLKAELDKMKVLISTVNKNEEFRDMLRAVEDVLRNFNAKGLTEIVNTGEGSNQSETKGDDKPFSSQEAENKKSVEKDESIDEKLESLKSQLDNMKAKFSTMNKNEELRDTLKNVEDLLQNFKAKSFAEIVEPAGDTNQSEAKDDEKLERLKPEIENKKAKLSTMKEHKEPLDKPKKEELVDQVVIAMRIKFKDSSRSLGINQSESEVNDPSKHGKEKKTLQYPALSLSLCLDNEEVELLSKRFQASYDALNLLSKLCCLSLSVFPENFVIKKRHIIYWWIGEGFVKRIMAQEVNVKNTTDEMSEGAFSRR